MPINWSQVIATVIGNTIVLSIVGFLAKGAVEAWIASKLEAYKSDLRKVEVEHSAKYGLLHQNRAAAIAELYHLLVGLLRDLQNSAQGVHQYADDQVAIPRQERIAISVNYYNSAVESLRGFREYSERVRIYFSDELISKVEELLAEIDELFIDLRTSLSEDPPGVEPPPSIAAIGQAQKRLRLLIPPLREELEIEFRRLLGVIDAEAA